MGYQLQTSIRLAMSSHIRFSSALVSLALCLVISHQYDHSVWQHFTQYIFNTISASPQAYLRDE